MTNQPNTEEKIEKEFDRIFPNVKRLKITPPISDDPKPSNLLNTEDGNEWLDKIITKGFNDYYDYITEKDIIKAAYEYSEKTSYKQTKKDITDYIQSNYILKSDVEKMIPSPSMRCGKVLEDPRSEDYYLGNADGYNECYKDIMDNFNRIKAKQKGLDV